MNDEARILQAKNDTLTAHLRRLGRAAVAFSAGVDSAFLLKTAHDILGEQTIAVTARCVSFPEREIREAAALCKAIGVRHVVVDVDQMAIPGFSDNPPDRCYLCKKALFRALSDAAGKLGFPVLIEGTNADDTRDYRPGMRALRELDIGSPLMEADLTKEDIRRLSRGLGLPTWSKPSLACLATRIPYGEPITPSKLSVIDEAEQFLFDRGFGQVRVRMHGKLARIETLPEDFARITDPELSQAICRKLTDLGFDYVTLDLAGYTTGSMNKTI